MARLSAVAYAHVVTIRARAVPGWADIGLLAACAVGVYLADVATKAWVVTRVPIGAQRPLLGDLVQLWHAENSGSAFSLFQGGVVLFVAANVAAVVMVGWLHVTRRVEGGLSHILLGAVLGGALGNLVDRLPDGTVTDWISVGVGTLRWPTFNVADSALVVAMVALVLLFGRPARAQRAPL